MSSPRCFFLRLVIGIAGFHGLVADAQDASASGKERVRGVRFVCTSIAPQTPETLKLAGRKGLVDVPLGVRAPGESFELPADGVISLGQESKDPQRPVVPLATGKLPEGVHEATALLIPIAKKPDGCCYHMILIADGQLKGGDAYFLNLLDRKCAVRLDGKDLMIQRGRPQVFHPDSLGGARNLSVAISIENPEKGWDLLTASTWRMRSTRIELCIIYWDTRYERPALKGLTLYPEDAGRASPEDPR